MDSLYSTDKNPDRFVNLKMFREKNVVEITLIDQIINSIKSELDRMKIDNEELIKKLSVFKKLYIYRVLCSENSYKQITEKFFCELEAEGIILDRMDKHILLTTCMQWKISRIE